MKKRVCVVVTARPSYSRIRSVLHLLQHHPRLKLQLIVTASALHERYGSVVDQIENDGFTIDRKLHTLIEGNEPHVMAKTTGVSLVELSSAFDAIRPDLVITIADRYETIATAIAATYMNIPLVHIQGGEITGSIDNRVRNAITKLADLHLVSSVAAAQQVRGMGEPADTVFVTGCPSIDIARSAMNQGPLTADALRARVRHGEISELPSEYLVVLQHSDTTRYDASREEIAQTVDAVRRVNLPTFWFMPNVDAGSAAVEEEIARLLEGPLEAPIWGLTNLEPSDFLRLIKHSRCLVGNSSAGIREASYLGVPVVNVGSRQNGRLRGKNVVDVGSDSREIARAIANQIRQRDLPRELIYGDGHSSKRIVAVIEDFLEHALSPRHSSSSVVLSRVA